MPAPVAVEIVANPAPSPDLARTLIAACSGASGAGGCALEDPSGERAARAHVVVTFAPDGARVRVESKPSPVTGDSADTAVAREVSFRDDDPPAERFRAAGLVVAGLVSELDAVEPRPLAAATPEAPRSTREAREAVVRLAGGVGWNAGRTWLQGELGGDFAVPASLFVAVSATYGQTVSRDGSGIADQRVALAAGGGLSVSLLGGGLEGRFRAELVLNEVRATIRQASPLRDDAGDRTLLGARGGIELVLPLGGGACAVAGGRIDYLGGATTIRVHGAPAEAVSAWLPSVALGLNIRLP